MVHGGALECWASIRGSGPATVSYLSEPVKVAPRKNIAEKRAGAKAP